MFEEEKHIDFYDPLPEQMMMIESSFVFLQIRFRVRLILIIGLGSGSSICQVMLCLIFFSPDPCLCCSRLTRAEMKSCMCMSKSEGGNRNVLCFMSSVPTSSV
jgi:hypothetical protein